LRAKGKLKMFDFGAPELLIILVIVILVFGPGRIAKTLGELGKGINSFRNSLSSEEKTESVSDANTAPK
jgi:sec-independent protein translocase protein TatA